VPKIKILVILSFDHQFKILINLNNLNEWIAKKDSSCALSSLNYQNWSKF
jgi:hypothetical protein